jgi:hypothetical protein
VQAQARDILRRAASLMSGERTYSRHAEGSPSIAWTDRWSATGALERAARPLRSGAAMLGPSDTVSLDTAKAAVCRIVGYPHIDAWEHAERPDWRRVRDIFLKAMA